MTIIEALEYPELDIEVTGIVEDCFYYKLSMLGRISKKQGDLTEERLKGKYSQSELVKAFNTADQMINNLDKYGVACISMM